MRTADTLLVIPTYNEADNLPSLLERIFALGLDLDILIVDDNSPDGTGQLVERIAVERSNLSLLRRSGKLGIGSAHLAGIAYAYANGYRTLATMDADFSHRPECLPAFLAHAESAAVVVGTRFSRRQSLEEWNWRRRGLTHFGHFLTKTLLNLPYDASGAFRVYRLDRIPLAYFGLIRATAYEFFFESLLILHVNGFSIAEVPIDLPARVYGHSKMRIGHVAKAVLRLLWLSLTLAAARRRVCRPDLAQGSYDAKAVRSEWNAYWADKKVSTEGSLYDIIARFYRHNIIKPSLNRAIRRYFSPGAQLLHAGCGGGEVDTDVVRYADVTALDISVRAIGRYQSLHNGHCHAVIGNIFSFPFPDQSFDGIYNLGVMEHFGEEHIQPLLAEMRRVLKPGGKVVLFWPPVYGLSVIALHLIHFVLNTVLRRDIHLHPAEPTKVPSAAQSKKWLRAAGLEFTEYRFGWRDAFTYAVVVGARMSNS